VSDTWRPHESQHARPPCPSPTPGVHWDSCPSSQWCHPATSCEELTHWKRLWCWEGMGAGGEGDDRGWDGWMTSLTRWTWVSVNSGSWWWTGRPGVLRFMRSPSVGHDWVTELNWTDSVLNILHAKLREMGSIPGLGRCPGGGDGSPLQYSYMENSLDKLAWWVHSP